MGKGGPSCDRSAEKRVQGEAPQSEEFPYSKHNCSLKNLQSSEGYGGKRRKETKQQQQHKQVEGKEQREPAVEGSAARAEGTARGLLSKMLAVKKAK